RFLHKIQDPTAQVVKCNRAVVHRPNGIAQFHDRIARKTADAVQFALELVILDGKGVLDIFNRRDDKSELRSDVIVQITGDGKALFLKFVLVFNLDDRRFKLVFLLHLTVSELLLTVDQITYQPDENRQDRYADKQHVTLTDLGLAL